MLEQLEKAEKGAREKDNLTRVAREEARAITSDISFKEQQMRRAAEAAEQKDRQLQAVTQRCVPVAAAAVVVVVAAAVVSSVAAVAVHPQVA